MNRFRARRGASLWPPRVSPQLKISKYPNTGPAATPSIDLEAPPQVL